MVVQEGMWWGLALISLSSVAGDDGSAEALVVGWRRWWYSIRSDDVGSKTGTNGRNEIGSVLPALNLADGEIAKCTSD